MKDSELETKVVVLSLQLPKQLWDILETTEEATGIPISEFFASMIRAGLLESIQHAKKLMGAMWHQSN